jgi:hypothetical protein
MPALVYIKRLLGNIGRRNDVQYHRPEDVKICISGNWDVSFLLQTFSHLFFLVDHLVDWG